MNKNKELLENQYKSFINKNDWYFFERLDSYIRKVLSNAETKNIVHNIKDNLIKKHWSILMPLIEFVNKDFVTNSKNIMRIAPSIRDRSMKFIHINQKYSTKINKRNNNKNNKELIKCINEYKQSINELHAYILYELSKEKIERKIRNEYSWMVS